MATTNSEKANIFADHQELVFSDQSMHQDFDQAFKESTEAEVNNSLEHTKKTLSIK